MKICLSCCLCWFLASVAYVACFGDFAKVDCLAKGMNITLMESLPPPRNGMWDLQVEGFPECPGGATKPDVGGGYTFFISYDDKMLCGVEPKSYFMPSLLSTAKLTLLLKDDTGDKIADSISCVYKTRFESSLLTFSGEVKSSNLLYRGTLEEDGTDVEEIVQSGRSVQMDFFEPNGRVPLLQRSVKMGDPLVFKIDVAENNQISKILPENCYFSAFSDPEHIPEDGTLPFVKSSCFNDKSGIVRQMFPDKMERNSNGTAYELPFQAFHFSNYGNNLYVHCTLLACIASQTLCDPSEQCYSVDRRRRDAELAELGQHRPSQTESAATAKEFLMTKFIIVDDQRSSNCQIVYSHHTHRHANQGASVDIKYEKASQTWANLIRSFGSEMSTGNICLRSSHLGIGAAVIGTCFVALLVLISCLIGRSSQRRKFPNTEKQWMSQMQLPPPYATCSHIQKSNITSF